MSCYDFCWNHFIFGVAFWILLFLKPSTFFSETDLKKFLGTKAGQGSLDPEKVFGVFQKISEKKGKRLGEISEIQKF